ncbi:MAG: hypothetical protein WCY68_09340 [Desulfuromonadales bacterium]
MGGKRRRAIEDLAREVAGAGSSLLLAADSYAMAEHAAEHGLISFSALSAVFAQRVRQQGRTERKTRRQVRQRTPDSTREAVAAGELGEALPAEAGKHEPPNVVIEAEVTKR